MGFHCSLSDSRFSDALQDVLRNEGVDVGCLLDVDLAVVGWTLAKSPGSVAFRHLNLRRRSLAWTKITGRGMPSIFAQGTLAGGGDLRTLHLRDTLSSIMRIRAHTASWGCLT